jgi:hypothetical protein
VAFEGLELSDGKLSRSVLRGLGAGNSPRLPGVGDGSLEVDTFWSFISTNNSYKEVDEKKNF